MPFHAGDIEATLDLDRSPFSRGLSIARAEAKKFEEHKYTARVDIDRKTFGTELKQVQQQLDRIGDNTETSARRSGNKIARALLNPVVIQLGLLPGVAAASAALGGAALGALTIGFGAMAAVALKGNDDIKSSFKDLWGEIKDDTKQAAAQLQPYGIEIARDFWTGWKTIQPQLAGIFSALGPQIKSLADGVVGLATNAMPGLLQSVRQSGPAVRGLQSLLEQAGTGIGQMFEQISNHSLDMNQGLQSVGAMLSSLFNNLGRLIGNFASAWSAIAPQFSRVFDKLLDAINNFVSGGLTSFVAGMKPLLGVVESFLNVVGPLADILGGMGGWLLSAAAGWKLLAGAVGLAGKAWGLLAPSTWATKLGPVRDAIDKAAQATGGLVTKFSGMPMAGAQFTNVMSKVGKAVTSSLTYLPLVGTAVAGATALIDHFFPAADDLATSIQRGGVAAEEAQKKMIGLKGGYSDSNLFAIAWAASSKDVAAAIDKQRASMTDMERAQSDAAAAQRDYQLAVDRFGQDSPQAIAASDHLAAATKGVENAQLRAAAATQTHIDKIIFQTNLMLGSIGARLNYQQSLIDLEKAQKNAAQATQAHGKTSIEAREANVQYQQSLLSVITSLGDRVKAENKDKTESEQNRLATLAMHQEIARLAVVAGKDAPVALQQLAGSLSDSELAALGVTKQVDKAGNAVYTLPPGKNLSFPTDAPVAMNQVNALHTAIDGLPRIKYLDVVISTTGGLPANTGLGGLLGLPPRARGGEVRRGKGYWVGDGGGPELFFPDVDGFVLNDRDSRRLSQAGGSSPTPFPFENAAGTGAPDDERILLLARTIAAELDGIRLRVEGGEWAKLVNATNLVNATRR